MDPWTTESDVRNQEGDGIARRGGGVNSNAKRMEGDRKIFDRDVNGGCVGLNLGLYVF